jgi:hypothetical protein
MRALTLILLAVSGAARAADPLALLPATGANVAPGELAAATDVLRSQFERTGRYVVVMGAAPAGEREPSAAEAVATARALGARLAATLRVSRLGAIGIARLAVYGTDGGTAPVHLDELPVKGTDDLEPALQRLAEGFARGTAARGLAQIDSVTEREADPGLYKHRTASRMFGLRLSSTFDLDPGDGRGRVAALSGLGFVWHYDARSFMADSALDFQWSQTLDLRYSGRRDWAVTLSLGAYYPFLRGDVTPILGGAVVYQWGSTGAESGGNGLVLRPAAGLVLGRLAEVQVRVEAGYQVNTFEERDAAGGYHRGQGPVVLVAVVK